MNSVLDTVLAALYFLHHFLWTSTLNDLPKSITFAVVGYSAFAIGDALLKHVGVHASTLLTLLYLNIFLLAFLIALSPFIGGMRSIVTTKHAKLHAVRAFLFFAALFFFIYGIQNISLAEAYSLLFTMPFMASLLAIPLLKEKVSAKNLVIIACGFAGVLIVLRPGLIAPEPAALGILIGAFLFALFDIASRKIGAGEAWITFAFYPALLIALSSSLILFFSSDNMIVSDPKLLGWLALAGAGHMAGGLLTARAYTLAKISVVSPFQYIQLLWAVLLGYVFFQEIPDLWTGVGAVVIVASGLALLQRSENPA